MVISAFQDSPSSCGTAVCFVQHRICVNEIYYETLSCFVDWLKILYMHVVIGC